MNAKLPEQLANEWAQRIQGLGLAEFTQAILPILKPMGALFSQVVWVGQPIASLLVDQALIGELALLLEDVDTLDKLEQQLCQSTQQ